MWQGTTDDGCVALADLLGWKVHMNPINDCFSLMLQQAAQKCDQVYHYSYSF